MSRCRDPSRVVGLSLGLSILMGATHGAGVSPLSLWYASRPHKMLLNSMTSTSRPAPALSGPQGEDGSFCVPQPLAASQALPGAQEDASPSASAGKSREAGARWVSPPALHQAWPEHSRGATSAGSKMGWAGGACPRVM